MTTTYTIRWAHGQTQTGYKTLEAAEDAVRAVLSEAEIGHDGDIADGGERTLFWSSEEDSIDDDGLRAAGSIVAKHEGRPQGSLPDEELQVHRVQELSVRRER